MGIKSENINRKYNINSFTIESTINFQIERIFSGYDDCILFSDGKSSIISNDRG